MVTEDERDVLASNRGAWFIKAGMSPSERDSRGITLAPISLHRSSLLQ
jgi:hypothetical protein